MAVDRKSVFLGIFFIVLGALFLAVNFADLRWDELWPLLLLAGGAAFLMGYFLDRRNYGLLMPAGILLVYGALFLYCAVRGWEEMGQLWPTFIMGPGVGLLLMYFGGKREVGLLIPASILLGLAGIFFMVFGPLQEYARFWPVLIILAGVAMLLRRRDQIPQSTK